MRRSALKKTASRNIPPPDFERLSRGAELGMGWRSLSPPGSVRLSPDMLSKYRALDPGAIERASRDILEKECVHKGIKAIVNIPPHREHRNVKGFVVYTLSICDRALEALSSSHGRRCHEGTAARAGEPSPAVNSILQDLEAMLHEEDEPDFLHRPTTHAYNLARRIIKDAYSRYVGSAPVPAIAPDGDGGLIIEWRSERRLVRLVVPGEEDESSYVYSKTGGPSEVDDPATDLILAQRLRATFVD